MQHTRFKIRALSVYATCGFAASFLLAACGGGGGSTAASVPTTATTFTAIDGLIKGAIVCVDANNNGLCETNETQGATLADGTVTLNVPTADIGKYPTLVTVPAGAIDQDDPTNPIAIGYTLKAPADNPTVITPLTTLVQHQIENGLTIAQATKTVQDQTGVTNAFANFVATPDANARVVAKTIVKLTQEKTIELASVKGATDSVTGNVVSQADVDKAVRAAIVNTLPAIVQTVSSLAQTGGACTDPTAAACKTAIGTAVGSSSAGLQADTGLTATNAATQSSLAKLGSTQTVSTDTPTAGGTLKWFSFTDISNWYTRTYLSTATENTSSSAGETLYRDVRNTNLAGTTTQTGGLVNQGRTDDIHWNGTAWVAACDKNFQNSSVRNGTTNAGTYNYCDGVSKGTSTRIKVDMSGKTIADMVATIRANPGKGDGGDWAAWGSSNGKAATQLAAGFSSTAVLPTGSYLYYYNSMPTEQAITYIISGGAASLTQTSVATAAGGDATLGGTTPTCAIAVNQTFTTTTSLDAVIAQNKGTPCKFGKSTITGSGGIAYASDTPSGTPNEWWGQSTLDIGSYCATTTCLATVTSAANATAFYTGRVNIRVAFTGDTTNKQATYYSCQERYDGGNARNCKAVGSGTYAIKTLGDAKILSFVGVSSQASPLTYERLYVERANVVRYAFMGKLTPSNDVRPNLTAMNALFTVLGIPTVTP
jgi:trimeric autotransporter adhesin